MTSRPFLDGPLSAGARRCQRRSCSLRCACSTLTPPTHRHGQHGSSNGHPRLECRQRGHPVCPSTAPAINGAPRGRSSTLLPCRGAVPGKVTPRRSPGRHLGDDGLEPEDPELGYFATSPQAGVFASSQFGEQRRVAPAGGARSDRHGGASSDSHARRRALRSIPGVRALLRASGEKCSVARSNVHDQCGVRR